MLSFMGRRVGGTTAWGLRCRSMDRAVADHALGDEPIPNVIAQQHDLRVATEFGRQT